MKRLLLPLLLLAAPPVLGRRCPTCARCPAGRCRSPICPPARSRIRVVRQSLTNPVAGVEVTSTSHSANGDARSSAAKTGADGRAVLRRASPPAATSRPASPSTASGWKRSASPSRAAAGTRVMLIAGLGAAPAGGGQTPPGHGGAGEGQPTFRMGAATGQVAPAPDLPVGTLELELRDGAGRPLPGKPVQVAEVHLKPGAAGAEGNREVGVHRGTSDAAGKVRFEKLTSGEAAGYAAVTEHDGMRLGTQPFRMPTDSGLRGTILALRRTSDSSALRIDPRSKVVIYLREDAIAVMVGLIVRNTSQEIFDGGEEGLILPLPPGAVGAQELEGGDSLDIAAGQGVRLKHADRAGLVGQFRDPDPVRLRAARRRWVHGRREADAPDRHAGAVHPDAGQGQPGGLRPRRHPPEGRDRQPGRQGAGLYRAAGGRVRHLDPAGVGHPRPQPQRPQRRRRPVAPVAPRGGGVCRSPPRRRQGRQ